MKKDNDTRAVIYCRVSDPKQVREGHGLESQESRCREYAAHKHYEVVETFHEEGVTGALIDRPRMRDMLAFLRQHRHQTRHIVIIDDISRLARGLEAHIQLRTAIGEAGGKLESPSIEFGEDSDSMLVENLLAAVSQHQREKNAEQVMNRMRARVLNGYWLFYPVVGYRFEDVKGHGKMIVPDEPNASSVRQALEGFASGRFASITEVKRFLESIPSFPRYRTGEVHHQFIREMLERPLYAGYISIPRWNIHLHPGKHEPLITFDTWRKIQDRLSEKPVAPVRSDIHADFPLRGFVTCSCCNQPMTAAWSKGRSARYPYYFCNTRGCPEKRRSVRKEHLEREFSVLLRNLRPTRELFMAAERILRDLWDARLAGAKEIVKTARAEVARIEHKTGLIMERLLQTDSPALIAAYEDQVQKLEVRKAELKARAQTHTQPQRGFEQTFRTACGFLANPCVLWDSGNLEDRRLVLKLAFGSRLAFDRKTGFRTAIPTLPFKALAAIRNADYDLVEPKGVEPSTSRVRF